MLTPGIAAPAQRAVDVHSHIITEEYTALLRRHGAELEETFPLPAWSAETHVAFMDKAGIECAVLTMPAPQPYYGDSHESAECVRKINEEAARVKARFTGRFKFCASLPLPDVDAAIREAIYALDTLKADDGDEQPWTIPRRRATGHADVSAQQARRRRDNTSPPPNAL